MNWYDDVNFMINLADNSVRRVSVITAMLQVNLISEHRTYLENKLKQEIIKTIPEMISYFR